MEMTTIRQMSMRGFVEYVAKGLVDNPSQVKVHQVNGGKTIIYELSVAKNDLGKVIGRQGQTAQAMRTLLKAMAAKEGTKKAILEILE